MTWRRLAEAWQAFWFSPLPAERLGWCRALFYGALFLMVARWDMSRWWELSQALWSPMWLYRVLPIPVLPPAALAALCLAWKVSLVLSCVGLWTRASTGAAFVLGGYLLSVPQNFGKIDHAYHIIVLVLGLMALSRCGDAVSLDRLFWRRPATPSGEYRWPIRLVWVTLALIFFSAGVSKLRHSGLAWVFSDNFSILLLQHLYAHKPWTTWGLYVAQVGWLSKLAAAASLAGELAYPLALVHRGARRVLVPLMFMMQVGITALMGPRFETFLLCNLFWVPWERVREAAARRAANIRPAVS